MLVTVSNDSPIKDYIHPDNHTQPIKDSRKQWKWIYTKYLIHQ